MLRLVPEQDKRQRKKEWKETYNSTAFPSFSLKYQRHFLEISETERSTERAKKLREKSLNLKFWESTSFSCLYKAPSTMEDKNPNVVDQRGPDYEKELFVLGQSFKQHFNNNKDDDNDNDYNDTCPAGIKTKMKKMYNLTFKQEQNVRQ